MNWCSGRGCLDAILCKAAALQVFPAGEQHFSTETHQCLEIPPRHSLETKWIHYILGPGQSNEPILLFGSAGQIHSN